MMHLVSSLLLLSSALLVTLISGLEPYDANEKHLELNEVNDLIARLQDRRIALQQALGLDVDGIRSFHSAFVPLAVVDSSQDVVAHFDMLRILRRDKQGHVFYSVTATSEGKIAIYEANGGGSLVSFSLNSAPTATANDANVIQGNGKRNEPDDSCASVAGTPAGKIKDLRVGSGGQRPFVVTLDESGLVRVHGLAIKRGNDLERASFWKEEASSASSKPHSDSSLSTIAVRPDVYIHTNGTAMSMIVYSTIHKSLVILGLNNGQLHMVDPTLPKSFTTLQIMQGVAVSQLAISQNQLAIAFVDGSIRFVTLGSNKLSPTIRCALPPALGSIVSILFLETRAVADRNRFFFVTTTTKDLLMYDRRSPDTPTIPKPGSGRGFLSSLVSSPSGKTCLPIRRVQRANVTGLVPLTHSQILAMTKRGPEVYNASTLFATHGNMDDSDESFLRRTDFITSTGNNPSDFAILLLKRSGKGAYAYSFLPHHSGAAVDGESSGASSSSSLFEMTSTRGPVLMVLGFCGFILTLSRRFGAGRGRSDQSNARRLNSRFGGSGLMGTGGRQGRRGGGVGMGGPSMGVSFDDISSTMDESTWHRPSGNGGSSLPQHETGDT